MSPRLIAPEDLPGTPEWGCWYCSRWGFVGDSDGRVCDVCGNLMCEECASVHECYWVDQMWHEHGGVLREMLARHDGDLVAFGAEMLELCTVATDEVEGGSS